MYRLLGTGGAEAEALPSANQPMWSTAGCHIRAGTHDLTEYGWLQFLDFAARHMSAGWHVSAGRYLGASVPEASADSRSVRPEKEVML